MKCGWIHLTLKCPEIPYEAPQKRETQYPAMRCWICGQEGHYARECPTEFTQKDFESEECYNSFPQEDTTYSLEDSKRPQIIDGYLYRPSSSVYKEKPISHPTTSYAPENPYTGAPKRKEST